ncbi:MAG: DUF6152 family protein [Devosia sp.]|nr:DUF6152 family protein [Devosia sp.]
MTIKAIVKNLAMALAAIAVMTPVAAEAHHSFAMYDMTKSYALTGVLVRSNPDAFHYQMFIAQLDAERKAIVRDQAGEPVIWVIELAGAAEMASKGITANSFTPGAIVSVGYHPLRNGSPGGAGLDLGLYKCPEKTPPAPGKFCDSVNGGQSFLGEFPPGTEEGHVAVAAN